MGRNNFNYPNTCPKIDKEMGDAKSRIYDDLYSLSEDMNSEAGRTIPLELISQYTDIIYSSIEGCFESVRESNSDIRSAAESQIKDLLDEIDSLKDEIKDLNQLLN
jgi:hypothetical protein